MRALINGSIGRGDSICVRASQSGRDFHRFINDSPEIEIIPPYCILISGIRN